MFFSKQVAYKNKNTHEAEQMLHVLEEYSLIVVEHLNSLKKI